MEISVPLAEAIRRRAEEQGLDVERHLADLLAADLDPENCVDLAEKYLKEAEELYARGDASQAGEKYWGAVASLLDAIAERRGWEHVRHRDRGVAVERLYREARDGTLLVGMRMAEGLHANFCHFMEREIEGHRKAVLLVERLKALPH